MKTTSCSLSWVNAHYIHHSSPVRFTYLFPFVNYGGGGGGKELTCKSQKLLLNNGLICPSSPGAFHLLPFIVRAFEKLISIVDKEMKLIGGQKVILPCMLTGELWKSSGRWDKMGSELFKFCDRHSRDFCLGSTHEEAVTQLISEAQLSHKHLPLKIYQITPKFRDEMRPRFGLLRNKEFWMKDMYSFDSCEHAAKESYKNVCIAYEKIFQNLGVSPIKVRGCTGSIGGIFSHEYHLLSDSGEDSILICPNCKCGMNEEISEGESVCPECNTSLISKQGIEVAHAFLLGTTYSKVFSAKYSSQNMQKEFYQMGCFGLGITRLLAALLEVCSSEKAIQWPLVLAPFIVCVIPPKAGSKESHMAQFAEDIAVTLSQIPSLEGCVLIDDRSHLTIGRRIMDTTNIGVPFAIIIGKKASEEIPKVEVLDLYKKQEFLLLHSELIDFFRNVSQEIIYD